MKNCTITLAIILLSHTLISQKIENNLAFKEVFTTEFIDQDSLIFKDNILPTLALGSKDSLNKDNRFRRYIFSVSAIPIKKHEVIATFDLLGPKFIFGIGNGFSFGASTSWATMPFILNLKYSSKIDNYLYFSGGIATTFKSLISYNSTIVSPFASLTFGTNVNNITLGYQHHQIFGKYFTDLTDNDPSLSYNSFSFASTLQISRNHSLLLESHIINISPTRTENRFVPTFALGLRYHPNKKNIYNFAINGIYIPGDFFGHYPLPIPFFSWTRIL